MNLTALAGACVISALLATCGGRISGLSSSTSLPAGAQIAGGAAPPLQPDLPLYRRAAEVHRAHGRDADNG